jgi:hypothetical protein
VFIYKDFKELKILRRNTHMTKKIKLFALALAVVLCLGTVPVAFAADGGPITGTEGAPAQAAISKVLKMPEGTTLPAAEFKFNVTAKSVDGDTTAPALATAPVIGTAGVVTIALPGTPSSNTTVANTTTYVVESPNIFPIGTIIFPHAGVYVYEITEVPNTNTTIDNVPTPPAVDPQVLTYSGGKYTMDVYVSDGTSGTYISAIATTVTIVDIPGDPGGNKVDPTPGSVSATYDYSHMIFTNTYLKNNGGTNPLNDSTLNISKAVTGTYASQTLYFTYSLTVTKPALVTGTPVYRGYIVEGISVVTSAENGTVAGTDTNGRAYINFPSDSSPTTVKLKHGQKLVFIDTPVGTTYTAEEAAAPNYTPSAAITTNGATINLAPGTVNTSYPTGTQLVGDATVGINQAAFTNARTSVTPTGINLTEMPYIGMIALAVVALGAYIAIKVRKRTSH